jgi:hypothetical protein
MSGEGDINIFKKYNPKEGCADLNGVKMTLN